MKKRALSLLFVPTAALAQSTQIESGISRAVPYLVAIGMACSIPCFIYCGIKYQTGDPTAKEHVKSVFAGAILILSASAIAGLLKSWFS